MKQNQNNPLTIKIPWNNRQKIEKTLKPQEILEYYDYPVKEIKPGLQWATFGLHEGSDNPTACKISYIPEEDKYLWNGFSDGFGGGSTELLVHFNNSEEKEGLVDRVYQAYEDITGEKIKKVSDSWSTETKKAYSKHFNYIKKCNSYLNNYTTVDNPEKPYQKLIDDRGYTLEQLNNQLIGYDPYIDCFIFPIVNKDFYIVSNIKRQANYIIKSYKNQEIDFYKCKNNASTYDEFGRYQTTRKNYLRITGESRYSRDYDLEVKELSKDLVYNYDSIKIKSNKLFITEGVVDSDNLRLNGYSCIARLGEGSNEGFNNLIVGACKRYYKSKEPVVLNDSDSSGKRFNLINIKNLLDNDIYNFSVMVVPKTDSLTDKFEIYKDHFRPETKDYFKDSEHYKDINAWYTKHYKSLDGILRTKIDWLEYIAIALNLDEADTDNDIRSLLGLEPGATIYDVIRKYYRFIPKNRLNNVISFLKDHKLEDIETIRDLKKLITKQPEKSLIRNNIMEKHPLMYNKKIGFYEFNKVWKPVDEILIKNYVNDNVGDTWADSGYIENITKLISYKAYDPTVTFNEKPLMVFNNGTLNLETGEFKKNYFNKNDKNSYISNYDYDPEADCRKWKNYLYDVLEVPGDPEDTENKIKLIQEYLGYLLFPDCRLQVGLILNGRNNNGKSVLIEIARSLFDQEASVDSEISDIGREHQAIRLKDKLLALTDESRGQLIETSGASNNNFKKAINGETIKDRQLYKDDIEFNPRCKWIVATNNGFITNDRSGAIDRRLLFVDFLFTFKENPDPKNPLEKQKIFQFEEQLKPELPGIFNWIYEGYKRLMARLASGLKHEEVFTQTKENIREHEKFKSISNGIRTWLLDLINNFKANSQYIDGLSLGDTNGLMPTYICYSEKSDPNKQLTKPTIPLGEWIPMKTLQASYNDYARENNTTELKTKFRVDFENTLYDLGIKYELPNNKKNLINGVVKFRFLEIPEDLITLEDKYIFKEII